MFSIAAINDSDSGCQWEPLAPTKEAQEFHLSQTYHEGLLHLQAKEYEKARELLEAVLKDPLISSAQVENSASDGHLLQLRFLALKNLSMVFLQQGSAHYESALRCYLQAVEIDSKDSVVWNQLGTLSCTMGLLSISRWAFEQGLFCSPNNWNCMEKLLEVLIAIGDEVSCLSVAELILRHWPSHSRALHVKITIEESEPIPFAPRGIDKLQPSHVRLKFSDKRKATHDDVDENTTPKRRIQNIELPLAEASWAALAEAILSILLPTTGMSSEIGGDPANGKLGCGSNSRDISISIRLPPTSEIVVDSTEGKDIVPCGENVTQCDSGSEKMRVLKEKEASADEEHPQERRSTRLERLRTRKPGKEELDFAISKDLVKVVLQYLEPFIVHKSRIEEGIHGVPCPDNQLSSSDPEINDVTRFITASSNNYGAYHIGHLFLEEVACGSLPYQEGFVKFLELEKATRHWGQDRSIECNLFLAELYYDIGLDSVYESKRSEYFSEVSYNLCKVIELVAVGSDSWLTAEVNESNNSTANIACTVGNEEFWVRFYWLSGRLSISYGDKAKAYEEFCISLSLMKNKKNTNGSPVSVPLPHCKLVKGLTVEKIQYEISLLKVDSLLGKMTGEMIEQGRFLDCINLLAPLILSTKDIFPDILCAYKEGDGITSIELLALDVLVSACEGAKQLDIEVYLNCHRRKLQLLTVITGMVESPASNKAPHKNSMSKINAASGLESVENTSNHWNRIVAEEVKAISRSASQVKNFTDQTSTCDDFVVSTIGDIQSLLLTVMCSTVSILCQKSSGLGTANQTELLESRCFVDAAIAFCKLQHLIPSIPVKTQVELIVAIHDLLAEHGLCCAGKDSEGEEGTLLKLAIKHLLALDMKLKSNVQHSNLTLETKQCDAPEGSYNNCVKRLVDESMLSTALAGETGKVQKDESGVANKDAPEERTRGDFSAQEAPNKNEEGVESGKDGMDEKLQQFSAQKGCNTVAEIDDHPIDGEREKVELGIDNALDQCFFCLYGLNLKGGPDSSTEDDIAIHKNTSRGDYQTKEQCADVFQYILPYAKALSRAGFIKLRRVLRAIRKHFPHPPEDMLSENSIDKFLDNPDLSEEKLCDLAGSEGSLESIINMIFPNGRHPKTRTSLAESSEPYLEVYGNLYHFLAQAEEMSATDKWPGFVLTKEGEDFVEQNANLFKYDLLYNPLRFDSWQRLANIYDEEVDLLLNDGSKHINVVEWRKHSTLPQRVEISRRRSRRCLLMSLALAKTPAQQSQIHELLALVYYDSLQNVVPFYDQRSVIPTKDAAWTMFCQNSMKHFEMAYAQKPDWSHAFYLGKLSEKLRYSCEKAFSYYGKAIALNPSAVDPVYRMHASRLKLLYTHGKQNLCSLQVVTAYCFSQSVKDTIKNMFGWSDQDLLEFLTDVKDYDNRADSEERMRVESHNLEDAWHLLYSDCLSALEICVEGELKHFHKARYMLAQGFYKRGESGDVERAKDELSFCFKSSRSSFTINMWEIDGMVKRARRKTVGLAGSKKGLEASLPESSRKYITCIRKYTLLYLNLLQKTRDICTLERAYTSLRTDKRFSLCLEDIAPVALGTYIQTLTLSIHHAETVGSGAIGSHEQWLEKLFNLFMDHGNLWAVISSLTEMKSPELTESILYNYVHQYIHSLECDVRLETLEGINEKIRKRFKNPKLSNSNCSKICKHASMAWCRSILISLASITPLHCENPSIEVPTPVGSGSENDQLLYVDLQPNELWTSSFEDPIHLKALEMKWRQVLSNIKFINIKQALEGNMEAATSLLRSTYNFYRESSCGTLPSGINVYTAPSRLATEGPCAPAMVGVEILDLSVPRKFLLWAHTLVHGRYSNILVVVKHCEENAKSRMRKGTAASSALAHTSTPASTHTGGGKETTSHGECGEAENIVSTALPQASLPEAETAHALNVVSSSETQKTFSAPQLHQCTNSTTENSNQGKQEAETTD